MPTYWCIKGKFNTWLALIAALEVQYVWHWHNS